MWRPRARNIVGQRQCQRAGFLQRSGRAYRKKIMNFANAGRHLRRRNGPADAPSGDAIGFGHAIDGDGAIAHAFEAGHGDVRRAVVQMCS